MAQDRSALRVEVLTPEGEVYSGEVSQISTRTAVGEIGILADHIPVLAALKPTELRLLGDGEEDRRYAQAHGWLQVFANEARVLVEEAVPIGDLDERALSEELAEVERRLGEAEPKSAARERASKDHERVEAFLKLARRG